MTCAQITWRVRDRARGLLSRSHCTFIAEPGCSTRDKRTVKSLVTSRQYRHGPNQPPAHGAGHARRAAACQSLASLLLGHRAPRCPWCPETRGAAHTVPFPADMPARAGEEPRAARGRVPMEGWAGGRAAQQSPRVLLDLHQGR